MKLTIGNLRKIIKEELENVVREDHREVSRGRCRGCGDLDAEIVGGYCYDCAMERQEMENERSSSTTFECRTCGKHVGGKSDGSFDEPGWGRLAGIDGPNAICPECKDDPDALEPYRDEYPNVRVVKESVGSPEECPHCDGTGKQDYDFPCGWCHGSGHLDGEGNPVDSEGNPHDL